MLNDFVSFALGLLVVSKEKAEELIEYLVDKGEMQRDEARKLVNRLVEKGTQEKDRYWSQVKERVDSTVRDKMITREDFTRLEGKVDELLALLKEKGQ